MDALLGGVQSPRPSSPFKKHLTWNEDPPSVRFYRTQDPPSSPLSLPFPDVEAAGILPEGIIPEGIIPEGIIPEGIIPEGIIPEGIIPAGIITVGNQYPEPNPRVVPHADAGAATGTFTSAGGTFAGGTFAGGTAAFVPPAFYDSMVGTLHPGNNPVEPSAVSPSPSPAPAAHVPYWASLPTPDSIRQDRERALNRPNTPALDWQRRQADLVDAAAQLRPSRDGFLIPLA